MGIQHEPAPAGDQEELYQLCNAIRCKLNTFSYLPRDLRSKLTVLQNSAQEQLAELEKALAQRRKLQRRIRALQLGISGQELQLGRSSSSKDLLLSLQAPSSPQRSLRRGDIVTNVHLDLNLIPAPQQWDACWVERLSGLTACDLTLLHKQHITRLVQCRSLPEEERQAQMVQHFGHYHQVSRGLRDLVPAAWSQRADYDMEMFMPLQSMDRPDAQKLYQCFVSLTTEEERECLVFLYREYKGQLAQAQQIQASLVTRTTQAIARHDSDYHQVLYSFPHCSKQEVHQQHRCNGSILIKEEAAAAAAARPLGSAFPQLTQSEQQRCSSRSAKDLGDQDPVVEMHKTTQLLSCNLKHQHDLGKMLWSGMAALLHHNPQRFLDGALQFAPIVVNTLDMALLVLPLLDWNTSQLSGPVAFTVKVTGTP